MIYATLLLVLIDYVFSSCVLMANITNNASEIFIRDRIADFDYARVGKYKKIYCCARNYDRIIWEFKKKDGFKWQLFPWFHVNNMWDNQPSLQDKNQTLQIIDIGWNNEGIYKCTALSSDNNVIANHSTKIEVYSCVDRVKPEAYGPKTQYGRVGETVTFTCTGDFGCTPDAAKDVSWYDEEWDALDDDTLFPRYNVTKVDRSKHTIEESVFQITTIEQKDFEKNFTCYVTSAYPQGDKIFIVQLKEARVEITKMTWITAEEVKGIVAPCVVILTLVFVFTTVFYFRIKLFILSRIPYWHLMDQGTKSYHAFILHEDEDIELAEGIQQKLQSDGYNVKISGSIKGGTVIWQKVQEFAQDSKSLIIIYPSEYSIVNSNNTFESLVASRQYFIPNLVTVVKKTSRKGDPVEFIETDRTFVRIKYPPDHNCSTYRQENFFCKLKLRMPRQTENNVWCCSTKKGQTHQGAEDTEPLNKLIVCNTQQDEVLADRMNQPV
ncbi:uncharacterized protein LOC127737721 [Mytilus californianus]|uniref:uncharacterized protein LOC127737721 n=1 Tax=Mytilus californianus TaxID=6549 RepID=UPI002247D825|nr:uncharacterized protein LOC127737721 [Mytilus californianus]